MQRKIAPCSRSSVLGLVESLLCLCFLLASQLSFAQMLQVITPDPVAQVVPPSTSVSMDVNYSTTPLDENLTRLSLRIHWDSSKLTFVNLTNVLSTGFVLEGPPQPDASNFDGDLSTDMFVLVAWADANAMWPGEGTTPVRLYTANFTSAADFSESTNVNFSAASTSPGWTLDPESATLNPGGVSCTLTVTKDGACTGTVTDTGIDCGIDCEQQYVCGTVVNLMQTEDAGCVFDGWGGDCSTDGTVTMDTDKECTATFIEGCTLTVMKDGTGGGTVTDTGIDCGTDCEQTYECGTVVTLMQMANSDSEFAGFAGADGDCSDGQVTVDADHVCTATFNLKPEFSLNVSIAGTGSGTVTDTNINCEPNCSANFFEDTVVSLTAAADVGSEFAGWSGDCSNGAVTTQVTMDGPKNCVATFDLKTFSLGVGTSGDASGTVTSSPGDIDCGDTCSEAFDFGTVVDLTATPDENSVFKEWTGDEDCTDGQVTMDAAKNCTAVFDIAAPDHFLCYSIKPRTKVGKEVSLKDQFETKDYKVKRSIRLCNPADKNGEGIQDPESHLVAYKIKRVKGESKSEKQTNVRVENQFGTISVDTKKADWLLVPTAKSLDGDPKPLDDSSSLDHYKCYKVKLSSGQSFPNDLQASVVDQFDQETLYDINEPQRLCNPVDKNGEGINNNNDENHLLCYKIKRAKGEPRHTKVDGIKVVNQFGSGTLATRAVKELCVPSIKTLAKPQ